MAARDIALMNAVYPDVPAVVLPVDGGGTARFTEVSDTTAVAADVLNSKWFYNAQGQKQQGTASGGGSGGIVISDTTDAAGGTVRTITAVEIAGTKTITQNGTGIDVASYESVDVNVPGYDMPKFVATFDQQTGLPTNVTCDKTFAEVVEYMDDANYYSLVEFVVENLPETRMGLCGAMYPVYSGNQIVSVNIYVETSVEGVAVYKILMASDGTLTYETEPIPTRDNTDLTASNLTVTVPNGYYESNATKTLTDQNLIASNIKKDVSIFGVTGTYEGGGGASNVVIGTFTGQASEKGSAKTITVPYSGSGYPLSISIYPTAGAYKSGTDIYTITQYKAIVQFFASKCDVSLTPDYTNNAIQNQFMTTGAFKGSSSNPDTYSSPSISKNTLTCYRYTASGSGVGNAVRFYNSGTNLAVYIAPDGGTEYGFLAGTEYTYEIVYSS